jgi:IS30 family transposase
MVISTIKRNIHNFHKILHEKIYTHLTTQERAVIFAMHAAKNGMRAISERLNRAISTISREIKRGSESGTYDANKALCGISARSASHAVVVQIGAIRSLT